MSILLFLLLSTITGIIEVGTVLFAIAQEYSVIQILLIVLSYQIGCFFPNNISLKKIFLIGFCILSILSSCGFYFETDNWWLLAISILFLSPCLQTLRSVLKRSVNTGLKRTFRILGFALSPLFSPILLLIILILCLILLIANKQQKTNAMNLVSLKPPYIVMLVHQMHYFSYTYIVLLIVSAFDKYHGGLTAFIFVLGWITYTIVPYILRGKKHALYLICGHAFLFIVILSMALTQSNLLFVILWILTGFGGGTVFCIKELLKRTICYEDLILETAENYGHVLGVLCSIISYAIFDLLAAPIIFAAICAITTVILTFVFKFHKNGGKKQND